MRKWLFTFLLVLLLWPAGLATAAPTALPAWQTLAPGLELGRLNANTTSGAGSPELLIFRIDPRKYRFQILADSPSRNTASAWRQRSGAALVCNIGQYDENSEYLGLLVKDGKTLSTLTNKQDGLFLAESQDPRLPPASVLDLRYSAFDPEHNPYSQAAQSLMLLDRYGQIRVRRSGKLAHRTLLGQDQEGRILLIVSEGRHTLWELAEKLAALGWLREIICMDGGPEAQLSIKVGGFTYEQHGAPQSLPDLPWPTVGLPMALAVFPR